MTDLVVVPQPGDPHTRLDTHHQQGDTVANPTGLDMLAEIDADKVYRDQAGRSWYRTWSNEVTREVAELVKAGWLSTRFVDGQWLLTDAGRTALKDARP